MISNKTKYALHALVFLAGKKQGDEDEKPIPIAQIAEERSIPYKFLEGILRELKRAGMVASKQGKAGGYYLLKDPKEINLADILRLMDGPIALLPCVSYRFYERCIECEDEETCTVRKAFFELRNQTVAKMKSITLKTLSENEE
jgi:Rrf2 family protein